MSTIHHDAVGAQATVGGIIKSLFPKGYLIDENLARLATRAAHKEGGIPSEFDDGAFYTFYDQVRRHESNLRECIIEKTREAYDELGHDQESEELKRCSIFRPKNPLIERKKFRSRYIPLPFSPYDLFAIMAVLLRNSGAYYHILPDPLFKKKGNDGRRIYVRNFERKYLTCMGDLWRDVSPKADQYAFRFGLTNSRLSRFMRKCWSEILLAWDQPAFTPISSEDREPRWWRACYFLFVVADRAAMHSGVCDTKSAKFRGYNRAYGNTNIGGFWSVFAENILTVSEPFSDAFEAYADKVGAKHHRLVSSRYRFANSLSAANRDVACILPKRRTAQVGCTLRSLSLNIALLPPRGYIRASWTSVAQNYNAITEVERRPFNVLVIPYPYEIKAHQFRPSAVVADEQKWGNFAFLPGLEVDMTSLLESVLNDAREKVETVHGIIFPELALSAHQFDEVYRHCRDFTNIELLCAGLNQHYPSDKQGKINEHYTDLYTANEAVMVCFERISDEEKKFATTPYARGNTITSHSKQHRWILDSRQIIDYDLDSALDPSIRWFEDLDVSNRKLSFVTLRDEWAATALICEDLARVDPAQQILRSIGPNLIVALLMDGPQIASRWPARYSSILADDPGSSVLTVNSVGLISRSRRVRNVKAEEVSKMNTIALWRDDRNDLREIAISTHSKAACLTLYEYAKNEFSMDGRRNNHGSTSIRLGNYFEI